ncbi:MAG: hypothetical protein LBI14_11735 [Treponema sp.]|jgi:hypothetical protein|nr:hypothetical protein [Treponema sp.]
MRRILLILILFQISQFISGQSYEYNTLIRILTENNTDYELRHLLKDYGGFGSSVHVKIPFNPQRSADEKETAPLTFVLAVPIDADFAVETALEFIAAVKKRAGNFSGANFQGDILVAFLGDEISVLDYRISHKGLRDLISLSDMPNTWVVCYLNIYTYPDALIIRHGSGEYIAPLDLVKDLPSLFKNHGIPASFEARYNELYKLGLTEGSGALALLWEGEINGISLIPAQDTGRNKIKAVELADLLLDYSMRINAVPENPDRHYVLLSLPGSVFFISESAAVIFLLVSMALFISGLLFFSTINRIAFISGIRLFFRYCWIFIVLLPLMVLIIRGTGFFFSFLHDFFNAPAAGTDFISSILIILLAGWLFMLLFRLLNLFHFYRKADFLGVSAVIIAAIGLLSALALDFTFVAVFLWAFLFALIGAFLKKPVLIFITALFVPLWALGILNNIRETGIIPVYFFISQGGARNWFATLQIALLCLPVILLLKRGMTLLRQNSARVQKSLMLPGQAVTGIKHHAPRIISLGTHISFLILLLTFTALNIFVFTREPEKAGQLISEDASLLSITLSESIFQESRIVNVTLESPAEPLRFNLFLKSEDNQTPQVHLAPVPLERMDDNSLMFILGENPPNPLNLEIVLRKDFRGSFWPEAVFDHADSLTRVIGKPLSTTGIPE